MNNSYIDVLKSFTISSAVILLVVTVFTVIVFLINRKIDNSFVFTLKKVMIVLFALCYVFMLPKTLTTAIDITTNSFIRESNVCVYARNNMSTTNGFDYFSDYQTAVLENGEKKTIITFLKTLPDRKGTYDIVYAKHSKFLVDYNESQSYNTGDGSLS